MVLYYQIVSSRSCSKGPGAMVMTNQASACTVSTSHGVVIAEVCDMVVMSSCMKERNRQIADNHTLNNALCYFTTWPWAYICAC